MHNLIFRRAAAGASAAALGMSIATALTVPARAAPGCLRSEYISYSSDYARVTDANGLCESVGVRHRYSPAASSQSYWTNWVYGSDAAQTRSAAELSSAEFYSR